MPTARAIPSSLRRSAASITKIRKMSRIPAAIENEPKVVKKEMNAAPALSAALSASCLVLSVSSPSAETVGCSALTTRSVAADAATVGDVHAVDQSRLTQQRLRPVERHQHAVVGRRRARVAHDRLHARALDSIAGQDPNAVSGLRAERVRALRVQVDLVRAELGERDGLRRPARIGPKAAREAGSPANSVTFGSYCPLETILDRRRPRRSPAPPHSTSPDARPAAAIRSAYRLGEVAGARACRADRE